MSSFLPAFIICAALVTISTASTICPNNPAGRDHQIAKFITLHNARRKALAAGAIALNGGRKLPRAANMLKMTYDCNLEATAIAQSARCVTTGSTGLTGTGENIAQVNRQLVNSKLGAIEKAISSWWKQGRLFGGSIGRTGIIYEQSHTGTIPQFAQMAWASASRLGCGITKCTTFYSVVCQYNTPPTVNSAIYQRGRPCTACPTGSTCASNRLLCVIR
ncbi:hypothetical protein RB195_020651 [Necator americanus]|uniref:SCP domain-containing protein n=1 Tax=Necator americanus TaxID=51031 RepID=A0ABR1CJT5_NECAM